MKWVRPCVKSLAYPAIEESKLLEESSDDDEKFFDAYDALDDLDRDIYNQIQSKSFLDPSRQENLFRPRIWANQEEKVHRNS